MTLPGPTSRVTMTLAARLVRGDGFGYQPWNVGLFRFSDQYELIDVIVKILEV
jgi:hypothetical protein